MHEQRLSTKNQSLTTLSLDQVTSPLQANIASSPYPQNNGDSNFAREGFVQQGNSNGFRGGRGHGRNSNRRVYCQLYGKPGYFVDRCYYRFDRSFQRMPNGRSQGGHSGYLGPQLDTRAYMASLNDSNGAYMTDYSAYQNSHCGNFSKPNLHSSNQFVSSPNLPDQS